MEFSNVTFRGPPSDDVELWAQLPRNLVLLLKSVNGFIQYGGGLHVRGVCLGPEWHSLRAAWFGETALSKLYPNVLRSDVPFAQDCVGDQFLLRDGQVVRLSAETGDVESFAPELRSFFQSANSSPVEYLSLAPLLQLHREGRTLEPGQLIHAHPPFCTKEAASAVSLRPISANELIKFHAELAAQLPPDGGQIRFELVE